MPDIKYSLPHVSSEHGFHTPPRAKDVDGLGEAVVVYQARVDGEQAHHEDDVTPLEECVPDLYGETVLKHGTLYTYNGTHTSKSVSDNDK